MASDQGHEHDSGNNAAENGAQSNSSDTEEQYNALVRVKLLSGDCVACVCLRAAIGTLRT